MRAYIFSSLFIAIIFTSCATPRKVNKWEASSSKTFFLQGVEYQAVEKDSVYAICGVGSMENDRVFLDLEITNKKQNPILFNPDKIYYQFKFKDQLEKVAAFNPEIEILKSKIKENELEASRKNSEALGATLLVLGAATAIVSEVAAATSETEKGYNKAVAANIAGNAGMQSGAALLESSIYQSAEKSFNANQRVYWERNSFRKSHINSNESMRGTVVLPIYDISSLIKLTIPIEDFQLELNFNQKQYSRKDLIELENNH
ncbi:MAG: hypothetical protein JNL75_03605 [Chitinophagales bacterium]|nr:hypothetical protein [Chitinophagales bacterium]